MLLKINAAKFLVKLGDFFQELPIFILQPKDLIHLGRISYSKTSSIALWADRDFIDSGLFPNEIELFDALPTKKGNLLLLGMGGGREAIFFAKAGFRVTGVDFIYELVEKAVEYARERDVEIHGIAEEISQLDFFPASFDVAWFSSSMYSSIPGRKARIEILKRVEKWLSPQGHVACGFYWNPDVNYGKFRWSLGKAFSWLTFGNIQCEQGDIFKNHLEFLHAFGSKEKLREEFKEAGFEVIQFIFPKDSNNASALLRKKN